MRPVEEGWVTAIEAGEMLGVTRYHICYLAQKHGWTRIQEEPGKKCSRLYFRQTEVMEYAKSPERRRRTWKRSQKAAHVAELPSTDSWDRSECVTVREAAEILGVRPRRVNAYIEDRRLMSRQECVGQKGSPHLLLRLQVESLRGNPRRMEHRWRFEKCGMRKGHSAEEKEWLATLEPIPDWLTTKQVARWLGVTEDRVRQLRIAGRFTAFARIRPRVSGNAGIWMHRKTEVAALLADPEFRKRRLAWDKGQSTLLLKAIDWTMRVNKWDRPDHMPTYRGHPGGIW